MSHLKNDSYYWEWFGFQFMSLISDLWATTAAVRSWLYYGTVFGYTPVSDSAESFIALLSPEWLMNVLWLQIMAHVFIW